MSTEVTFSEMETILDSMGIKAARAFLVRNPSVAFQLPARLRAKYLTEYGEESPNAR